MHEGIKSYSSMNMRSQISQIFKKLLDLMPGQRTLPRPQLYHHAIFISSLLLMWFLLHLILWNERNKIHETKQKMHKWISFGLSGNMVPWTLFSMQVSGHQIIHASIWENLHICKLYVTPKCIQTSLKQPDFRTNSHFHALLHTSAELRKFNPNSHDFRSISHAWAA